MAYTVEKYDTQTLMGVYRDMAQPSTYWLDLLFPTTMTFDTEYIDFEKLTSLRKLAPFVAPTAQGVPIYGRGTNLTRFKPAYIKPKDAVLPSRMFKKLPGQLLTTDNGSPKARWDATVADILSEHRNAIERRWEWLAAKAIIDGKVLIEDDRYPARLVDFQRAGANTVVLTGTARWGQSAGDIMGNIETWRTAMRIQKFGGPVNRLTVSPDVWNVMRQDAQLLKQLDTQVRGTGANFTTGIREGELVEYVGMISGTLAVYVYSDYYEDASGTAVQYMPAGTVVLSGPNVQGVRAFGGIVDAKAGLQPLAVFSKMWEQEDPSAMFIMTQSAPLMVPVNPNNTLKATVL